jgi:4-amino-4-deoxy-L-arabinose transferase-like glycosyltransferase
MQIKNKNINNFLIYFLIIHLIVWTAIPSVSNVNLPLDTIEALAWGSSLEWGYFKHPPLSAWFTEIFYQLFGNQDWAYYFLSQIFVISAFFIVFKFSEYFFNNLNYSLISILLLEGIYFYNYTTPEFNVNVCQLPFWALSILYCWKGIENNKNSDWLLFGLFAALGVLSKYLFIYLLISIDIFFLYMIIKKKISFKCLVSIIPFFLVLSPHLIWLAENDYATINYALQRAGGEESVFSNHLFYPVIFLLKQIGILIPFFLMVLFLVSKFKINLNLKNKKLLYLLAITIVPIILMFFTSAIMGAKIRTMWMTPFYLFFGVLTIYIFQSQINLKKIKNFITVFIILFILSPFTYFYISITQTEKRTDYKGRQIANNVQMIWNKKYKSKIKYVKGDEWYAGNLSYHLESRPKWLSVDSKKIIRAKDIMLSDEIKIPVRLYGEE